MAVYFSFSSCFVWILSWFHWFIARLCSWLVKYNSSFTSTTCKGFSKNIFGSLRTPPKLFKNIFDIINLETQPVKQSSEYVCAHVCAADRWSPATTCWDLFKKSVFQRNEYSRTWSCGQYYSAILLTTVAQWNNFDLLCYSTHRPAGPGFKSRSRLN